VGRAALRHYWSTALGPEPSLDFEVLEVYAGIDTLMIRYRNELRPIAGGGFDLP
jgi:hypothetical protein